MRLDATNGAWSPQNEISLSIPAIVGISLGATALVTLIIFLIFLLCRQRRGEESTQYDRIEGPPRKTGGFFAAAKRVTSYRPGLNFDLVKNRTGDLVELSPPSQNQDQARTQSTWESVSSLVSSRVRTPSTRHEPQKRLGHDTKSSLSSIFTRPKEVRSQGVPPDFDISGSS
jgi:hypothetical protein